MASASYGSCRRLPSALFGEDLQSEGLRVRKLEAGLWGAGLGSLSAHGKRHFRFRGCCLLVLSAVRTNHWGKTTVKNYLEGHVLGSTDLTSPIRPICYSFPQL